MMDRTLANLNLKNHHVLRICGVVGGWVKSAELNSEQSGQELYRKQQKWDSHVGSQGKRERFCNVVYFLIEKALRIWNQE